GFMANSRPQILPVNYVVNDSAVVFRTTADSVLLLAVGSPVVFEVDGFDEVLQTGWSVCVHGVACELVPSEPLTTRLVTWAPGTRERWITVTGSELTGRRIPVAASAMDLRGWTPGVL